MNEKTKEHTYNRKEMAAIVLMVALFFYGGVLVASAMLIGGSISIYENGLSFGNGTAALAGGLIVAYAVQHVVNSSLTKRQTRRQRASLEKLLQEATVVPITEPGIMQVIREANLVSEPGTRWNPPSPRDRLDRGRIKPAMAAAVVVMVGFLFLYGYFIIWLISTGVVGMVNDGVSAWELGKVALGVVLTVSLFANGKGRL